MRKHLKIAQEDLREDLKSGGAVSDPALREGASAEDDVSDLDHLARENLQSDREDLESGQSGSPKGGQDKDKDDHYGDDRVPMHGAEVHDVDVEHVTLEQALLALEQQCLAIEEAAGVVNSLDDLAAEAQTPMNQSSRKIFAIATESLLGQVGDSEPLAIALEDGELAPLDLPKIGGVSKEADPQTQTLGERIKKIWQVIVAAIKKAYKWLVAMFRRFFDMAGRIKASAESTRNKLKKLEANKAAAPQAAVFNHPANNRAYEALRVGLHFPVEIVKEAEKTRVVMGAQLGRFKAEDLYSGKFLELLQSDKLEQIHYDPENEKRVAHLKQKAPGVAAGGFERWETEPLMGGQTIVQQLHPDSANGAEALVCLCHTPRLERDDREHAMHGQHNPYHRDNQGFENLFRREQRLPIGSLHMGIRLCEEAIAMSEVVLSFRDIEGKLEKLSDKMLKLAEDMLKPGEKKVDLISMNADRKSEHAVREYLASGPRIFAHEPAKVVHWILRVAAGINGYCGELVKIYSQTGAYVPAKPT